ncbi:hypothetical protein MASR2M29_03010 [Spirochaetota bacterium]
MIHSGFGFYKRAFLCMLMALLLGNSAYSQDEAFAADYAARLSEYRAIINFEEPISPTPELMTVGLAKEEPGVYSLAGLLELAGRNNPGLMAAKEAEAAAAADLRGAKARRLPSVKAEGSGSFIGNPIGPISIGKGQFGSYSGVALPPQDVLLYKGMESSNYSFKLIGDQPLFTWGKIKLGVELAQSGLNAAATQRLKAERELAIKIRGTWDALSYLQPMFDILDLQARLGSRLVELAEQSAAAGFITRTEHASAKIKLKEIDIARVKLEEQRDRLLAELAAMSGLTGLTSGELKLAAYPAGRTPAGREAWPLEEAQNLALANSLDLSLLDSLLDVKTGLKNLAEKEAKGLPDLGLHIELSYGGSRFPFIEKDWFRQDDYQLSISLGTSGNIFGNAVKAGEAAKARAQLAEARAQRLDAERSIKSFIKESYLTAELGRAKLEYASLKQESYMAELEQARAIIDAGAGSESDYLGKMMEALGSLAEAYATLIEYRSVLLGTEAVTRNR